MNETNIVLNTIKILLDDKCYLSKLEKFFDLIVTSTSPTQFKKTTGLYIYIYIYVCVCMYVCNYEHFSNSILK